MRWPWHTRPMPPDIEAASQRSKDEMTAATEQLKDVVAELRSVVDEFKRVAADTTWGERADDQ